MSHQEILSFAHGIKKDKSKTRLRRTMLTEMTSLDIGVMTVPHKNLYKNSHNCQIFF